MSPSGSLPKSCATNRRTAGTRVLPPTRMTPSSSSRPMPASFSARRQASPVRWMSGAIHASISPRVTVNVRPSAESSAVSW